MERTMIIRRYSGIMPRASFATVAMRNRLVLLALLLVLYAIGTTKFPAGGWDARIMWTLRAVMLNEHGFITTYTPQSMAWAHLDYPPLLSVIVAAAMRVGITPAAVHGVLFALLVWLVSGRRVWAGALVGAAALTYAPSQYADVPLALGLLCAVLAFQRGRYELTGLALGICTLIKNEGLLIALAFFVVWALWERRIPLVALRGAQTPLALLLAFKLVFVTPNDLVASTGIVERLLTPFRYVVVLLYVVPATIQFAIGAFPVLIGALALTRTRLQWSVPLLAVLVTWAGYIGIYIITPHDLVWHLPTSYDRLLVQLFPALVVALTSEVSE